jgi:excisionase family DNA binding protein
MVTMREDASAVVMTVPEAGRRLGLGRNAAYDAAARGEIPTIRIGKLLRVPKVAFDRMLERAGERAARETANAA